MSIQLKRFLITGVLVVGIDLGFYLILLNFIDISAAKAMSFILGTAVAFIINKYWTFEKQGMKVVELFKFLLLYLSSLAINVFSNIFFLSVSDIEISFIIATTISATINFLGQKYWVFR